MLDGQLEDFVRGSPLDAINRPVSGPFHWVLRLCMGEWLGGSSVWGAALPVILSFKCLFAGPGPDLASSRPVLECKIEQGGPLFAALAGCNTEPACIRM